MTNKKTKKRRSYDPAFKREAVALAQRIGIPKAAEDLGINGQSLRTWTKEVEDLGSQAFLPKSQRTDLEAENRRLKEELRVARMERDILKKAAAFFAKDP